MRKKKKKIVMMMTERQKTETSSGYMPPRTLPSHEKDKPFTPAFNKAPYKEKWAELQESRRQAKAVGRPASRPAFQYQRKKLDEFTLARIKARDKERWAELEEAEAARHAALLQKRKEIEEENLRDIAVRCAAAMDEFIAQYDSQ
ncbi:hypothetical protein CRUP_030026 [Coryphaenoides rupestris]|nr:hypothetical protein CRUP_030026 [Coryphaenoides rupestris]